MTVLFFRLSFRPEVASDIISGANVGQVATYKMRNFDNAKVAAKVMCTMRKSKHAKVVIFNIFHNMHIHMNYGLQLQCNPVS